MSVVSKTFVPVTINSIVFPLWVARVQSPPWGADIEGDFMWVVDCKMGEWYHQAVGIKLEDAMTELYKRAERNRDYQRIHNNVLTGKLYGR